MYRRFVALFLGVGLSATACAWEGAPLPATSAIAETSRIYGADGGLVTSLHGVENREVVPLSRIPKALQDAVVAIEDERFWSHGGVDLRAVARAAASNTSEGRVVEGGSTITQQYVKNELLGSERTAQRKLREASLAYSLEEKSSKGRILELYLNSIYLGNGAYGVEAASRQYFGIPVEDLSLAQAALLAGIIYAPTEADPYDHPDVAIRRRGLVLEKMAKLGFAEPTATEVAALEPLGLRMKPTSERYPAPYFIERVKRFILDDPRFGSTPKARRDLLFAGGLKIHTTLDMKRQARAEDAVAKVLSEPDRDPEAALVALEPNTGYVRALVGGRGFFEGGAQGKFDLATQGARPAGSAFKPFVLAAALQQGIPLGRVYDAPRQTTIALNRSQSVWQVENYEGSGGGRMRLLDATVHSINTVYAHLILEVGPSRAVDLAKRMGITTPLDPYPSAVLGTNDVRPIDMAAAYGTLANRGVAVPPTFVTKVLGRDGSVIYQHRHTERRALDEAVADAEVGVLRQVVDRGTGVAARLGRPAAGKTGTGQEWRDAWFVGFTPDLVAAVWIGFPDAQRSMVPPATRTRVTGGSWPARVWQLFMSSALASAPVREFVTAPEVTAGIDEAPLQGVADVVGMPVEKAELTLGRDGFRVQRRVVPNRDYPPGYVVDQAPEAGSSAPGGSVVVVSVSATPASQG